MEVAVPALREQGGAAAAARGRGAMPERSNGCWPPSRRPVRGRRR